MSRLLVDLDRLTRARDLTAASGLDAMLVTPGPDLRYLSGYDAIPLERLTCLVLRPEKDPVIVVPLLEVPAAAASPLGAAGIEILSWGETDDPYARVASLVPGARRVAVDDHMWAEKVLALREAMPAAEQSLAGTVLRELRMRKKPVEIEALAAAGHAIDAVHADMGQWLRAGRSEREIGSDIAEGMLAAGHATVDFVIVASGPNGASPHHELSDRVVQAGDPVVVDIGGTTPEGYCSDSTRTYCVGTPPAEFLASYEVLHAAQEAACQWARPGVTAESVDAAARDVIEAAGYGELFVHRTGHGIGLSTHEEPYIVAGNTLQLEEGMSFSIEPGIYHPGIYGARIEDIVVCTDDAVRRLNLRPRALVMFDA
ncbi:MAG TPA: Xaa-Pro peptidase family protein [Candidatus Limnocylindria bacterium]|nr:Xaa-Pro peptidase family protein [Candidatus Limnocylindria bacterium]